MAALVGRMPFADARLQSPDGERSSLGSRNPVQPPEGIPREPPSIQELFACPFPNATPEPPHTFPTAT